MALKFKKLSGGETARIYQKGEIKGVPNTGYLEEFTFNYHLTPAEVDQILKDANLPFNETLAAQGMPLYSVFGVGGEQNGEVMHTSPYYSFDIVDLGVLVNVATGTELCAPNQYFLIGWNAFASSFGGETDDVFILYASELPNGLNSQLGMPAGWNQLNDFLEFWGALGENVVNDTYFNLANEQGFKFILFENTDLGGPIYDIGQANNNLCPLISWKYIEGYEVSLKGDYKPESFSFKATPDGINISVEDYLNNQIMPVKIKVAPDKRPYQLLTAHDYRSFSYNTQLSIDCSEIEFLKDYAFNEGVYFSEINFSDKLSSIGDYAFTNTNITSIDLPETVDTIGKYAFSGTSIKDFTIPLLTEELCEGAFKGCYGLETINVRYPIFVSGGNCFEGCGKLTNFDLSKLTYHRTSRSYSSRITIPAAMFKRAHMGELKEIPSNIEIIHDEAFYGTNITEIALPELGLGENVFSYCSNLKKVDFSKNSFISAGTFAKCTSLSEIIFSDKDLQVKDNAFSGCTALTSFPFDQATEIGAYAFKNCKGITKFNSENEKEFIWKPKITSIGENAFEGCSITSVKMTNYIPEAGKFPFTGISSLSIEPEEGVELSIPGNFTPYKGLASTCTITLGEGVCSIGRGAFYPTASNGWATSNKIYLPKSLQQLESYFIHFSTPMMSSVSVYYAGSFNDWCNKFMGVKPSAGDDDEGGSCYLYCFDEELNDYTNNFIFDENIEHISDEAFADVNLGSVEFANPNTTIGTYAFARNDIKSLKFPMNLQEIPEGVLKYCHHLDVVEFPTAPTKIGKHAFYNSSEWGSPLDARWSDNIIIPSTVKEIGEGAFYKCSAKAIELPEGLEIIGAECFMGNGITSGNIPSTVTKIGAEAFNGNGLTTLNIGPALTEIEDLALVFNKWETITVDENNPVYDSRNNCNAIIETATNKLITGSKNTIIPDGVVEIGDYSIGKTDIEQIIIPNSVTTIGQGAFKDCAKLTSITLPSHIKELKYRTLYNCDLLTTFEMPDDLEVIEQEAMAYCAGLTTVHINDKLSRVKKAEVSSSYSPFYSSSNLTTLYLSKNFSYLIGSTDTSNYSKMFNFSKDTSTSSSYPTITTLYYKGTQEELNQLTKSQVAILHRADSVYVLNGEEYVLTTDLPVVDTAPEDVPFPEDEEDEEEQPEVVVRITKNTTPGEYKDNQEITKVIIEEGVTDIANETFEYCYNLKEVILPSTIKNIGEYAFYSCRKLKEIVLPSSLETLNYDCFYAISDLKIYYRGTLNDFLQIKVTKHYSYSWRSSSSLVFWLDSNNEWTSTIPENLILEKGNPNLYLLDENSESIKTITCLESVETITPNFSNWDAVTDVYVHSLEQYSNGNNIISNDVLKNLHVWNKETQTYDKITTLIVPDEVSISIDGFSFEKIFLNQNSSISGCPNLRYVKIPEGKVDFPLIDLSNTTQEVVYIDMPTTMSTIWSDDTVGGEEETVFWIFRGIKPLIIQDKYDNSFYPNKLYAPEEANYLFSKAYRWNTAVFYPIERWYEIEDSIVNG